MELNYISFIFIGLCEDDEKLHQVKYTLFVGMTEADTAPPSALDLRPLLNWVARVKLGTLELNWGRWN